MAKLKKETRLHGLRSGYFKSATYTIHIDTETESVSARSELEFEQVGADLYFDLVPSPGAVRVDKKSSSVQEKDLKGASSKPGWSAPTKVRLLNVGAKGAVEIEHALDRGVSFAADGVELGLRCSDARDRALLEQYLPCGFEEDPFDLTLTIGKIEAEPHWCFASGHVPSCGNGPWKIELKDATSSSLFLHLLPRSRVVGPLITVIRTCTEAKVWSETTLISYTDATRLETWNGTRTPTKRLQEFHTRATAAVEALAKRFDKPPLDTIVVARLVDLSSRTPSMEYQGAIEADEGTVFHEIAHLWFGRGLRPRDVQALWIDEAICSWLDRGSWHTSDEREDVSLAAGLGNVPAYQRFTPERAYTVGQRLLGRIAGLPNGKAALEKALAALAPAAKTQPRPSIESKHLLTAIHDAGLLSGGDLRKVGRWFDDIVCKDSMFFFGPAFGALREEPEDWVPGAFEQWEKRGFPLLDPDRVPFHEAVELMHVGSNADACVLVLAWVGGFLAKEERLVVTVPLEQLGVGALFGLVENGPGLDLAGVRDLCRREGQGGQPLGDGTWRTFLQDNAGRPLNWGVSFAYTVPNDTQPWYMYGEVADNVSNDTRYEWWESQGRPGWTRDSPAEQLTQYSGHAAARARACQLWSAARQNHGYTCTLRLWRRRNNDTAFGDAQWEADCS